MIPRVLLIGALAAVLAFAQRGGGGGGDMGGGGGDMGGGGGMGMRPQKQSKSDLLVSRLKLNKEQTDEVETILQAEAKDGQPVVTEVLDAKSKLATALLNGKSGADLEPLYKTLATAQWRMTGVEVRAFQRIVGVLKPNQIAKAPEAFDIMADIFVPASSAGRGGRPGGMRGGGGGGGGNRGGGGGR